MTDVLSPTDVVGGSFWLLSTTMIAASFFFLLERKVVAARWHTSVTIAGVVTTIAAVQYFYMRDMWVATGTAPIIMRYLDWMLSFPLQVALFYVVLAAAVTKISGALFWRLLVGALVMTIGQFLGAAGYMSVTLGFLIGMIGWLYVLGELYMGEAGKANANSGNQHLNTAFNSLRLIVTIGWAIYPLGYFIEHLGGGVEVNSLNVIYNLADFLNKLVFCLVVYRLAVKDTREGEANAKSTSLQPAE